MHIHDTSRQSLRNPASEGFPRAILSYTAADLLPKTLRASFDASEMVWFSIWDTFQIMRIPAKDD
jgi:hypothetical protein